MPVPQVLAVHLDQVERVQEGFPEPALTVQGIENRDPVRTADHGLSIQGECSRPKLAGSIGDCWKPAGPFVTAAREQTHGRAVAADDEPVAVVLDLMIPIGSGWRRGRERRQAWLDEAFGREHAKAIRSATQEKSHPCCPAAWARPLTPADEVQAKVLTEDDARRVAVNITRLTALLGDGNGYQTASPAPRNVAQWPQVGGGCSVSSRRRGG
jgi:hypothetical protein